MREEERRKEGRDLRNDKVVSSLGVFYFIYPRLGIEEASNPET